MKSLQLEAPNVGKAKHWLLIGAYPDDPGGDLSAGLTDLISGHSLDLAGEGTGGVFDIAADLGFG